MPDRYVLFRCTRCQHVALGWPEEVHAVWGNCAGAKDQRLIERLELQVVDRQRADLVTS